MEVMCIGRSRKKNRSTVERLWDGVLSSIEEVKRWSRVAEPKDIDTLTISIPLGHVYSEGVIHLPQYKVRMLSDKLFKACNEYGIDRAVIEIDTYEWDPEDI